jgi:hypothetical protein
VAPGVPLGIPDDINGRVQLNIHVSKSTDQCFVASRRPSLSRFVVETFARDRYRCCVTLQRRGRREDRPDALFLFFFSEFG